MDFNGFKIFSRCQTCLILSLFVSLSRRAKSILQDCLPWLMRAEAVVWSENWEHRWLTKGFGSRSKLGKKTGYNKDLLLMFDLIELERHRTCVAMCCNVCVDVLHSQGNGVNGFVQVVCESKRSCLLSGEGVRTQWEVGWMHFLSATKCLLVPPGASWCLFVRVSFQGWWGKVTWSTKESWGRQRRLSFRSLHFISL